jgi:hypothetical protein
MSRNPLLADEDIWQRDGHLTDLALTALADGERALLPEPAAQHADGCDGCTARLGELAVLSLSVGEALSGEPLAEPARVASPRAHFPFAALVVALVLAGLGALPALFQAPRWLPSASGALLQSIPIALRGTIALFKVASAGSVAVVVVFLSTASVLCALGLAIARFAPREIAWKGVQK